MSDEGVQRLLVAAGASDYDYLDELPGVQADLAEIALLFAELGYANAFPDGLLNLKVDPLRRTLAEWIRAEDRHDDALVVYYSGHGETDRRRHYLMCSDGDAAQLTATALATEDLVDILVSGGVKHLLVIIDTCHAGQGTADALRTMARRICLQLAELPGSTGPDRYGAGPATFSVIAAARSRDLAEDGVFGTTLRATVDELRGANGSVFGGQRQRYLHLRDVVRRVNERFEAAGVLQRAATSTLIDDGSFDFIPNPVHADELPIVGVDLAEQHTWISAPPQPWRTDMTDHFDPRGRGVELGAEAGQFFTGRVRVLTELVSWIRHDLRADTRCVVVTGSPGVGKSAVLGRLVLLADAQGRRAISAESVPLAADLPVGSVHLALHARHLTLAEVLQKIATAAEVTAHTTEELFSALAERMRPLVIVIDALDEAGPAGDVDEPARIAVALLSDLPRLPCVRLLIGTRNHVVPWLNVGSRIIDLDDHRWAKRTDFVDYAEKVLLQPHGPGSSSPYDSETAHRVAGAIARRSFPNFLIARLTARALASADTLLDTASDPAWEQRLPATIEDARHAPISPAFRWALSQQLGTDAARARALLLPLAFAEGQGMPWGPVWPAVATAIANQPYSDADIVWVMEAASSHIVESVDPYGRSVYRLYHESFAEDLRDDAPTDTHRRISQALIKQVPLRADSELPDWDVADPYVLSHLATHAAAGDTLDHLVADSEYLVHAEPATLGAALQFVHSAAAKKAAAVYRSCRGLPHFADPVVRRHLLAASAARYGDAALARSFSEADTSRWRPLWSTGSQANPALRTTLTDLGGGIWSIACARIDDRSVAVTAGVDGTVRRWDLSNTTTIGTPLIGHVGEVYAVECTDVNGRSVAISAGTDATMRRWNLHDGCPIGAPMTGHSAEVTAVTCTTLDGQPIAVSASHDGTVRLWPLTHGTPANELLGEGLGQVWSVACADHDGRQWVLAGCAAGLVRLWDLPSRKPGPSWNAGSNTTVYALATAHVRGHTVVVAGCADGTFTVLDIQSGKLLYPPIKAHDLWISQITTARVRGRTVTVTASGDQTVRLWDLETGAACEPVLTGHAGGVLAVACTALGNRTVALTGSDDKTLRIWDLESNALTVDPMRGHNSGVPVVALSPGETGTVVVSGSTDKTVRLWDRDTGTQVGPTLVHRAGTWAMAVGELHDRPVVVTGTADGMLHRNYLTTGEPLGEPIAAHDNGVWAVACSQIGTRSLVATGGADCLVRRWDLASGIQIGAPMSSHRGWIQSLACTTANGRPVVVTGGADAAIGFWDLISGERTAPMARLHTGPVLTIACTTVDERVIAVSGGRDGFAHVWDVASGQPFGNPLIGHDDGIWAIACGTIDGVPVAITGSEDHTVRTWNLLTRRIVDVHFLPAGVTSLAFESTSRLALSYGWEVLVLTEHCSIRG